MDIIDRIKELRIQKAVSFKELELVSGKPASYFAKRESRQANIDLGYITIMSNALGIEIHALLRASDPIRYIH